MARQKYVLPGNKRDEAIRWINNLHEKQFHSTEYRGFFKAASEAAHGLRHLLSEDSVPASLLRDELERCGSSYEALRAELSKLSFAVWAYSPKGRPGTLVRLDQKGRQVGPAIRRKNGKLVRGRKEHKPLLRLLIFKLLELSDGRLTYDKNNGKGSLTDALNEMRSEIDYIIPRVVPSTTVSRIVKEWRKNRRTRRRLHWTRIRHLTVVK